MTAPSHKTIGRLGGLATRAKHDPYEYAAAGLRAMNNLERAVDPDGKLAPEERAARAKRLKSDRCTRAGVASGQARRRQAKQKTALAERRRAARR